MADVHRDWRRDREGDRVGDILRLRQLEAVDEALVNFGTVAVDVSEQIGRYSTGQISVTRTRLPKQSMRSWFDNIATAAFVAW